MIRFAVIGTHWITEKFVDAAHQTKRFSLSAVYSREENSARRFGESYSVTQYFTSLDALAKAPDIDAVYIASPNSLHFEQAALMLSHHKHVICEKPIASNLLQTNALIELAKMHGVVLFEAFKAAYVPNFALLRDLLPKIGRIRKAVFNYCQYSSRYPAYLAGENPNTFNPAFSNGSVMDIGFYCVAFANALWGAPQHIYASATLLPSGVDGHGSAIFDYGTHDCLILHSKISDSALQNEIQGEDGTLIIEGLSNCSRLMLKPRNNAAEELSLTQIDNTMIYEAHHVANLIAENNIDHPDLYRMQQTAAALTEIRRQTKVVFPADTPS